jgi:hypothetical protein
MLVPPPIWVDRTYGLLSVVQARFDTADQHWRNGVTYQTLCGAGGSTNDDFCVTGSAPRMSRNMTTPLRGATPFTVFTEVDCSPVGYTEAELEARAVDALTRIESLQVERSFWTGSVNPTGGTSSDTTIAYPHLAANAQVNDPASTIQTIVLQTAATTVTGSTVVDIVEGINLLETAMGNCYNGQPVLHVPMSLAEQGFRAGVFKVNGNHLETQAGKSLVALGAGYTGSAPDGSYTPGASWVYATGQVFAYRSAVEAWNLKQSMNRSTNTTLMQAQRTYVLGFECCHFGVPISLGGIVTGIVGAPN